MSSRLKLHDELTKTLGFKYVYYNPPESLKLTYPCIVYHRESSDIKKADNKLYLRTERYTLTYIHQDPDDNSGLKLLEHFDKCSEDRSFKSGNLNHDTYTLYY